MSSSILNQAQAVLGSVRRRAPRVHCLTNTVAQQITANLLLALGARVSLSEHPDEVGEMAGSADAVLINLGTLNTARVAAVPLALDAVDPLRKPVVLDPVFADVSTLRRGLVRDVLARDGVIIKGNGREMAAIEAFAAPSGVRVVTGPIDRISGGDRVVSVANGHAYMADVTAVGCAEGALIAACAAVADDYFTGAVAAVVLLGIAGELAAEKAQGPGTFAAHLIDAVAAIDAATFANRARLS